MSEPQRAAGTDLDAARLYELLSLRVDVFVVEQKCAYAELDGKDLLPGTTHFWVAGDDGVLGCLRVLEDGGQWRIGRVCTRRDVRGEGVGARLTAAALDHLGPVDVVLSSQRYATGFYARFGFAAEGEPYDEDGIPHITMRRPGERSS